MEATLLERLGKVAGVGGISIGAALLIFKDILGHKFLAETGLAPQQAFAVVIALMVLTFGIAGVGILGWLVGRGAANKPVPNSSLYLLAFLIVVVLGFAVYVGDPGRQEPGPVASIQSSSEPVTSPLMQFTTEQEAQKHCPTDVVVWANLPTGIYHFQGQAWYGKTKSGAYVCQKEADKADYRPTHNGQ